MTTETISSTLEFVSQNWEFVSVSSAFVLGAIGLSFKQRQMIRERDENTCQSTDKRINCGGRLEIDHILPKEFADQVLHMDPHNHGYLGYNDPPNLLTKCENHHKGHPSSHHPDVHEAAWQYRQGDKQAISRAIASHHEKAQNGQIYWNNEMDGEDRRNAIERSVQMDKKSGGRRKWWFW